MARSDNTDFRRIQDNDGDIAEISPWGYTYTAGAVHNRINKDVEYHICYEFVTVPAGSTVTFTICTNAKFPHGDLKISSNAEFSYDFDVGTTHPDGGATQVYPFNLNRGVNLSRAVAEFFIGETNGDQDKTIECGHVGALDKFETIASRDSGAYWLLDSTCTYHLRITNKDDAASYVVVKYRWHEHCSVPGEGLGEDAHEYDYVPI